MAELKEGTVPTGKELINLASDKTETEVATIEATEETKTYSGVSETDVRNELTKLFDALKKEKKEETITEEEIRNIITSASEDCESTLFKTKLERVAISATKTNAGLKMKVLSIAEEITFFVSFNKKNQPNPQTN